MSEDEEPEPAVDLGQRKIKFVGIKNIAELKRHEITSDAEGGRTHTLTFTNGLVGAVYIDADGYASANLPPGLIGIVSLIDDDFMEVTLTITKPA